MKLLCPHCLIDAALVPGAFIYGPTRPDLADLLFWACPVHIDVYVGCHQRGANVPQKDGTTILSDGTLAKGTLAGPALRKARRGVHAAFDPLWEEGKMSRNGAYAWLANEMQLSVADCHIGMFSLQQCHDAVKIIHNALVRGVANQQSLL